MVEHVFRQESGKVVCALTGLFGLRNLELVEDAVQEALLKALRQWSYRGIPENPSAWLMRVAKNQTLDGLRRETRSQKKETEIIAAIEQASASGPAAMEFSEGEIKDDQLRMIFACCHPALSQESQVALTLKTLCGFNVEEIARAFLTSPQTIAKRLTRARQRLRESDIPFAIPSESELPQRLDPVLTVLYLLFNEGYNASAGTDLIREDLCKEAIRLASLVQEHGTTGAPRIGALLALMFLQTARFFSRSDHQGEILLLSDQDRTKWDRGMIAKGLAHLNESATGEQASAFHLQAGIAACHSTAPSYDTTDWAKILFLYDLLLGMNDSPVIALNRAVALSKVRGAEAGLAALREIKDTEALKKYYLYYAVRAAFETELMEHEKAVSDYERALKLTALPAEKAFLTARLRTAREVNPENS
jgi:RNA polymerase sigma-70 factor (ECF subfamily)